MSSARQADLAPPLRHAPWSTWGPVAIGLLALYAPTIVDLARSVWMTDQQGQGPVVFALAIWLVWRQRERLGADAPDTTTRAGWLFILPALAAYALGRSQGIWLLEVGSLIPVLVGVILLMLGTARLRLLWFPLFFLCFIVPLPGAFVDAITQPMKLAVSYSVEQVLYVLHYPISRSGVILTLGPYQLLVADACAGLNTLFTLEALGLLYLNVIRSPSVFRNVCLAALIVPIGFVANIIRVCLLALITYYFGDEAGQGYLHGFAGMALFLTGLMLIVSVDGLLQRLSLLSRRGAA